MGSVLRKTFNIIGENIGAFLTLGFNFSAIGLLYCFACLFCFDVEAKFFADISVTDIVYAGFAKGFIEMLLVFMAIYSINCILDFAKGKKPQVPIIRFGRLPVFLPYTPPKPLISSMIAYSAYIILWAAVSIAGFFGMVFFIGMESAGWSQLFIISISSFIALSFILSKYLFAPMLIFEGDTFDVALARSAELSKGNKSAIFAFFALLPVIFYASILILMFYGHFLLSILLFFITCPILVLFMSFCYLEAKDKYIQANDVPAGQEEPAAAENFNF